MRTPLIATALAGLVATGAAGQIGNPAFMAAGTRMAEPGKPAPNQANDVDRLFARLAAAGLTDLIVAPTAARRWRQMGPPTLDTVLAAIADFSTEVIGT